MQERKVPYEQLASPDCQSISKDCDTASSWTTASWHTDQRRSSSTFDTMQGSAFGTMEDLPAEHFAAEPTPEPASASHEGVLFSVHCAGTRLGFHLRVVGSCKELGCWAPERGLPLHTSAAEFPTWHSAERFRLGADVQYKYVVCDVDGKAAQWEDRANRLIGTRAGRTPVISEIFNFCSDFDECTPGASPDSAARFQKSASLALRVFRATRKFKRALHPLSEMDTAQLSPLCEDGPVSPDVSCELSPTQPAGTARANRSGFLTTLPPAAVAGSKVAGKKQPTLLREQSRSEICNRDEQAAAPGAAFHDQFDLVGQGPLGEGSFGLVWRCERRADGGGAQMAAKIMNKQRLSDGDLQNIAGPGGEVDVQLGLRHENIVSLFGHFDEEQTVTLVMEYCGGGDLFDLVAGQARVSGWGLPEEDCVAGARQILAGLEYLHSQAVVHRDLKCENILLANRGTTLQDNLLKICDFGFAAKDDGAGLDEKLGSPDTVAPEVISGRRYGFSVDIWATGVIFYMMLSAKSPFFGRTDVEVLRRVRSGRYSFSCRRWDQVSDAAKAAIAALLVLEPTLRPNASGALQHRWLS